MALKNSSDHARIASGASAGSQNAIGAGVLGGMATATVLAVIFVPVFYVLVLRVLSRKKKPDERDRY